MEENKDGEMLCIFKASSRRGSQIFLPPLAKNDSFYDGSIQNFCENEKPSHMRKDLFLKEVYNDADLIGKHSTVSSPNINIGPERKTRIGETFKISKLVDTWFWCNPCLMFLLVSRFLGHFSMVLFFMFLPSLLLEYGFSLEKASLMLTVIGISNTVFRIVVGALMDHPRISPSMLTALGFVLQAVVQCLLPFVNNYAMLMALGGVIGVIQAPYNVGLSIILGEMVPMKNIASTFAKMALFQGIGSVIGPSVAGMIYDITMDIKVLFFVAASINILGGIACGLSIFIYRRTKIKDLNTK